MKRTIKNFKFGNIILLFALIAAFLTVLAGCAGSSNANTNVSFEGGSSFAVGQAPEGGTYSAGDVITLPECPLRREGYVFAGWSDGDKRYQPGERYTVGKKEVRFTAIWAKENLNVRFLNYDGSLLAETTVPYGKGLPYGYVGPDPELPESEIAGHRKYWDAEDGWEPAIPEIFTADAEFTAKFSDVPIEYRIRFYDEAGGLYKEFYQNYGSALKAPGKNPEKNVPVTEIHVERYDFVGWKRRGEPDSLAVPPDETGAIGTVAGDADFVPVFREVKKVYAISVPEHPAGYTVGVTGGVTVGGAVKVTITLDKRYSRSVPHASVDFGGALRPVDLTARGGGVYEGTIDGIERNGTLSVTDVEINRYRVGVTVSHAEISGLEAEYPDGETVTFTVVPDEHYRRRPPVVTIDGIALTPAASGTDGAARYAYSFFAEDDAELSVEGVADVYSVTVEDGYGNVSTESKTAGETFAFKTGYEKPGTEQFDYLFKNLTEKNGKLGDKTFSAGGKLPVWDDYDFIANFEEKRKEYDVTIRVRGEETTVRQTYGKAFSEFLPAVDQTIVETVRTYTFTGWFLKSAAEDIPLPADAAVTGNAVVEAVYDSEPTLYDVTLTYFRGGAETVTVVKVPYNTAFSKIDKPEPDDLTTEGKYFVWVSEEGIELDGAFVTSALSATAEYRVFVFTVTFEDETGAARPEWTQAVEWGKPAAAPTVPAEYKTDAEVFTFTGWSEDLTRVYSDLAVRPLYDRGTRYYNVTLRSETDAVLREVSGDRTFGSVYAFRLDLSDRVDPRNVKVFLRIGDAAAEEAVAEEDGIYRFFVTADATAYLDGVGNKKFTVTLPVSETFAVTALDPEVVEYGGSFRFSVAKGEAYSRGDLTVTANGAALSADAAGVYTVPNIRADVAVAIPDLPINVYSVKTERGDGIASVTAPETVEHGGAVVWTVTLAEGYDAEGLKYETSAAGIAATSGGVYTVTLPRAAGDVSIRFYGARNRCLVTVSGANFTSDKTEATVLYGDAFTATITLAERYNRSAPNVSGADADFEKLAEGVYRMTVAGVNGDTVITVNPILDVYTLTAATLGGITAEGDTVRTVKEGETAKLRFLKGEGFTQTAPKITLSDGTELTAEDEGDAWSVTVPAMFGDETVTVEGILNVYRITLPGAEAQTEGGYTAAGEATARYGKDYILTVTPDSSRNLTAPTVTLDDGTALTDPVKKDGGYVYTIHAVKENYIVSIKTRINVYSVKFSLPNGETIEKSLTHGDPVAAPVDVVRMQYNETDAAADYVAGWTVNGRSAGYDLAGETATGSVTYTAVKRTRYYTAKIGEKKYLFLETALEAATTGQTIDVLQPGADASVELGGGKTVPFDRRGDKKEYELKTGVTLRLPYKDNLYSDFGDNDNRFNTSASQLGYADNNENLYLNLRTILPVGYTLNAYGEIQIGGVLSSQSQGRQGQTSSYYAELKVDGTLNVYGTLKTFGYVKGTGNVISKSGAYVYQPFVVNDYKGGGHTSGTNGKVSPFNMFSLQNVQPGKFLIEYGAFEVGYAVLWTNKTIITKPQYNRTDAYFVAPDTFENASVLKMGAGAYIENTFERLKNPKNETETITKMRLAGGTFIDGAMELQVKVIGTITVTTAKILLPISYLYQITVARGATFTVENKYKLMPGTLFEVEEGAVLNLDGTAIVYETFDPTGSTLADYEYNRFYAGYASPANLINNGTLNVNGSFGGFVGGVGSVTFGSAAGISVISDEYSKAGSSATLTKFFTTTQTARGNVNGALTEFRPGNTYRLS